MGVLGETLVRLLGGHSTLCTDQRATCLGRATNSPELRTSMLATTRILFSKLATARLFCSLLLAFLFPIASISCSLQLTLFGHVLAHRHAFPYPSDSPFSLSPQLRERIVTTDGKAGTPGSKSPRGALRSTGIRDFPGSESTSIYSETDHQDAICTENAIMGE